MKPGTKYYLCFYLLLNSFFLFAHGFEWKFREAGTTEWYPAGRHIDLFQNLLENKLIPDPHVDTNERAVQWVENKDWIYETSFRFTPKNANYRLCLEGVDTYADVYLNDSLILRTSNAFLAYNIEITPLLRRFNVLQIRFYSPVKTDLAKVKKYRIIYPADNDTHPFKTSAYTRKPPYHFGWDFAPRLAGCRANNVELVSYENAFLENLHIVPGDTLGKLYIGADVYAAESGPQVFYIQDKDKAFAWFEYTAMLRQGRQTVNFTVTVNNPELWWPNGLGKQKLYTVIVMADENGRNGILSADIGFRDFKVIRKPDQHGERFYFEVNGKPFFSKGANYIQTDRDIEEEEIKEMVAAGYNTLRVWGGANYGGDKLYELCDKHGIMIWQDFMFSGTMYPGNNAFMDNVRAEAIYQVKRLRNHPSLALWCGNNEIEVAWKNWGWQKKYKYSKRKQRRMWCDYTRLFHELLPQVVSQYDAGRYYLPSSPVSNWGKPQDFTRGDNHFWGVYHGNLPFEAYNTHIPRFVSEYGFQSFPEIWTLRQVTDSTAMRVDNKAIAQHQKSYKGNGLLLDYMVQYYKPPADFGDFVYKSQLQHADAVRIAAEAHRRNTPYCMGSLYWQYNDVWPAISWSVTDYFGNKKAAWYAAAKAFQPVILSPVAHTDSIRIWLIADNIPVAGEQAKTFIKCQLSTLTGKIFREQDFPVTLSENSSHMAVSVPLSTWLDRHEKNKVAMSVKLYQGKTLLADNVLFLDTLKNIDFPPPDLDISTMTEGNNTIFRIRSGAVVKSVYLSIKDQPGKIFSANYFDLWPGEEKVITIALPGVNKEEVIIKWLE